MCPSVVLNPSCYSILCHAAFSCVVDVLFSAGHMNYPIVFHADLENKMKEVPANGVMVLMFSCVAGALIG